MANVLIAQSICKTKYVSKVSAANICEKVKQVVASKENNLFKIEQIKLIEKEQCKPLVRELAHKKSAEELKDLAVIMKDLGYLTYILGDLSGEIKYYNEAAIFYQYGIVILDEVLNKKLTCVEDEKESNEKKQIKNAYKQLGHIQMLLFSAIGGNLQKIQNVKEEATTNKNLLVKLRDKISQVIKEIEAKRKQVNIQEDKQNYKKIYVDVVRTCFENIAEEMKLFLKKLYSDSEQQMAVAPPCKYAIIGLGSMALKQMTPYSDFEFAILTENDTYLQSDDPKIREYFKNVSHLVNFKIVNLGESIIPTSKYDLDLSHLVKVAVNLDLGGKTPLGRIGGDKVYNLIQTVNMMLSYVHNEENWASHIDKNLPYILQNVCYIYGDNELVITYKRKVTDFLHSHKNQEVSLNCELRAITILKEGILEIDYLQKTPYKKPKEFFFEGDIHKLQPEFFDTEGQLFDVKQEIYRLLDRMVYNLGLYYGIEGDSAWDTIDKLEYEGIINSDGALNLKNSISFATTIRLKTYSHHKAQREDLSIFVRPAETATKLKDKSKNKFYLDEADLDEEDGLFQYFYTALPLHEAIKDFCDQCHTFEKMRKESFFKDNIFYKNDYATKGFIYFRLVQYKKSERNLTKALDDSDYKNKWQIRECLGRLYLSTGNYNQAFEQFEYCSKMIKLVYRDEPHTSFFSGESLNNLGIAYSYKKLYDEAIECYNNSQKIYKLVYQDEPNVNVAFSLNNIGEAYRNKGQLDQAIVKFKESLKIMKLIYKSKPHPGFAASLNNLGLVHNQKQDYDKAIKYYKKSLEIYQLIYKDEPHPRISDCLNNLGISNRAKGQYDQAIKYYMKSIKILKFIYQDEIHPYVADSLNNLGIVYAAKLQYDQAIKSYEECLNIYKLAYKDETHKDIAFSLKNLGSVYSAKGQHDKAIEYYKKSLHILKIVYQDNPHPNVVILLNSLGNSYLSNNNYDQAINYQEKSLKMERLIYQDKSHLSVAYSLHTLGVLYKTAGKYDLVIKYCEESLNIKKNIYKDEHHPSYADSLLLLGTAYADKKDYDKAINYYIQNLYVNKLTYRNEPHPIIADSLNNLALIYTEKGQYDQAIIYYEQSLAMNKLIYHEQPHPSIAYALKSLGLMHSCITQNEQAIKYCKESYEMYKLIYQNEPHVDVAFSLYYLGIAHASNKSYDEAINYYEQSLIMKNIIYQNQPHPSVAIVLNNLGLVYADKEQYDKAIKYHKQAWQIIKFFKDHPYKAAIKNNFQVTAASFAKKTSSNPQEILSLILDQ